MPAAVHVLGIRHHGPGSARAVRAALDELQPDAVLIEGPPEAESVLALAADEDMRPPVALLVYRPDAPERAAFYPFAVFSPEWVAARYGLAAGVPVRFIDLPAVHALADGPADEEDAGAGDPLARLAEAAGHDDPERWWEDMVELRDGALDVFAAIADAMRALREDTPLPAGEARREAAMRRAVRRAEKDGHERIAVVCGAWHAPVLQRDAFPSAASDDALLRGLPKVKVAATWVPWTNDRLGLHSGYGAGVRAPGWYHHLFTTAGDRPVARWMQRAAALLRAEDLDASPASVVEAVRLADALGAVRGRPHPGLAEVGDAALAVLAQGSDLTLRLIERRLVVGEVLGEVPPGTPMVPLVEDVARLQRRLRLKPEASDSVRELDLRKENDLARSELLHRLDLLGVPWGRTGRGLTQSTGTFRETWALSWEPEFSVRLIEAARYGATVEAAATGRLAERAARAEQLGELTQLLERTLLASLPRAVALLMEAIAAQAAADSDIGRLMDALVPLARVHRYGSVRGAPTAAVGAVVDGLVARIRVGLPAAAAGLDDDAAAELARRVDAVDSALGILDRDDLRTDWRAALGALSMRDGVHALLVGRTTRLLLDAGIVAPEEARRRMGLELSRPADADRGAAFLEGFLAGSGLVLLHDPALLALIDGWLTGVPAERFDDVLPLLRRAFSSFAAGERRQLGQRVRTFAGGAPDGAPGGQDAAAATRVDRARGDAALATVLELLGGGGAA